MTTDPTEPDAISEMLRRDAPHLLLDLFYPFHYKVGFAVENALRGPTLTQQQAIILWIIRSEGEGGIRMRRKEIERRLLRWFDITSSAISKALRAMAAEDMGLMQITEDPASGREKLVELTPAGEAFIADMIDRSTAVIRRIIDQMGDQDIYAGMHFMRRVVEIVATFEDE